MKGVFRKTSAPILVPVVLLAVLVFASWFFSSTSWSGAKEEDVLAKVGDFVITNQDLNEMMTKFQAFRKEKPFEPEEKKRLLDSLVKSALVAQEAEKLNLDKDPAVQSKLKLARMEVLVREYVTSQPAAKVKVSDEEVNDFMKQAPNMIPRESLMLREVVVKTEGEAKEVAKELKKGMSVVKLANERSIDPASKRYGGKLPPVSKGDGKLPKAVEEAVFKLKVGEFTAPMQTEKGWTVFFLEERKERTQKEVDALNKKAKEKIEKLIQNNKLEGVLEKAAADASSRVKVEKHYDRIK